MARDGATPDGAEAAAGLALAALASVSARRAGADHPALYAAGDNPWTDLMARDLRDAIDAALPPEQAARHAVAARWRFPSLLPERAVLAAKQPLYDIAWRVYAADGGALAAQPLIAECPWRGGWRALSGAADRLAQGRADVKLLCAMDDPSRAVGEGGAMTLAEACAFRIAAFAPAGERVLLAFYGQAGSWRETPGFSVFSYITGAGAVTPVNLEP